jgi:hypothetical protein
MLARRNVIFYYTTILPLLAALVKSMAEASYSRMGPTKADAEQQTAIARLHEMTTFAL